MKKESIVLILFFIIICIVNTKNNNIIKDNRTLVIENYKYEKTLIKILELTDDTEIKALILETLLEEEKINE